MKLKKNVILFINTTLSYSVRDTIGSGPVAPALSERVSQKESKQQQHISNIYLLIIYILSDIHFSFLFSLWVLMLLVRLALIMDRLQIKFKVYITNYYWTNGLTRKHYFGILLQHMFNQMCFLAIYL